MMKSHRLLSVIVPAYNSEEWLPRCLDSILNQTYKDLEILVIDDGSTDGTGEIADRYAERNERIVVIHQKNRGLAATRDLGIKEARGEYIGFVDSDDEIIPEMYEKLVHNAISYDAQISQCGIMYCFYDGRRKAVQGTGKLTVYNRLEGCSALLKGKDFEPSLCNKIYRSDLLKESCLDQTIVNNEDMLRNIVLFNRAERSVMEDLCGYFYWRRAESMSNNRNPVENGRNILRARKTILEYVPAELKKEAFDNYRDGAIDVYNSLVGNRSHEADRLRKECREILSEKRSLSSDVSYSVRMKTIMILYFPAFYNVLFREHLRRRRKRIQSQAAFVSK